MRTFQKCNWWCHAKFERPLVAGLNMSEMNFELMYVAKLVVIASYLMYMMILMQITCALRFRLMTSSDRKLQWKSPFSFKNCWKINRDRYNLETLHLHAHHTEDVHKCNDVMVTSNLKLIVLILENRYKINRERLCIAFYRNSIYFYFRN